jgi:hypothetical protein
MIECASETATPGQPTLARELERLLVALADHARVVGLDPVDLVDDVGHRRVAQDRPAEPVERVRQPHETALLAGGRDRLGRREAGWDRAFEEGADHVAVASLDLLTHDDHETGRREITRLEGGLDPIVVGDREVGQPPRGSGLDDVLRRRQAVEAAAGVAVQVDERAVAAGASTRDASRSVGVFGSMPET